MSRIIYPPRLRHGDKVAIVSPASVVKAEYIAGAEAWLGTHGFTPVVLPYADGPASGSYASGAQERLNDLTDAMLDPEVKAILCARGGYGCVHLLPHIPLQCIRENPKWIMGFSDISALHALWNAAGVASLHAPMAKHLTEASGTDPCADALLRILRDGPQTMCCHAAPHRLNICGEAVGTLIGGNLAVLNNLAGTPYDMLGNAPRGAVIFIEDISEAIYAVERMLTRLAMSGVLQRAGGLVFGHFSDYRPDRNHPDMETMVSRLLERWGITGKPVAFGFPVGHEPDNFPLVEGARVEFRVSPDGVALKAASPPHDDDDGGEPPCPPMTLQDVQAMTDKWIHDIGGGYFSELTNMALLTEETGELARVMARTYGDQIAKPGDMRKGLAEETADVLWVLTCLANQTGVDLTRAFRDTLRKKTERDRHRFK